VFDLGFTQARELCSHVSVLPAGKIWMKTHTKLKECCDAPADFNFSSCGFRGPSDYFKKSTFTRTVVPNDPDCLSGVYGKIHLSQNPL